MIILVYFIPNASGLVWAKNLRKWAEKAFVSSTLVFHAWTPDQIAWPPEAWSEMETKELQYECH
jgi:hypothetical protein